MTSAISTKLTYEDYLLFPDDGKRHEIIDGEHYVTAAPSSNHQFASSNIEYFLEQYVRQNHSGRIAHAPFSVVLSDTNVVEPDIVLMLAETRKLVGRQGLLGAPDLAVEILSDSNRKIDEGLKRKLYERYGVFEYWIVDPDQLWVKIFRRSGDALAMIEQKSDGAITTPLLPGFTLALSDIFDYF